METNARTDSEEVVRASNPRHATVVLFLSIRNIGTDRVILGNISTITDMLEGSPDPVYQAFRRWHEIAGKAHIVGTGCEVPPASRPENLHAMVRYSREHSPEHFDTKAAD